MQGNFTPNEDFLRRTDFLSKRFNCSIKGLSRVLGLSERTITLGRNGAKISQKTWKALEAAEHKAGIYHQEDGPPIVNEIENFMAEHYARKDNPSAPSEDYKIAKILCDRWLKAAAKNPRVAKHLACILELHLPNADLKRLLHLNL